MMEVLLIVLMIVYVIGAIITFGYVFVELTLDADGLAGMLLGTFVSILAGIFWPIALLIEILWI